MSAFGESLRAAVELIVTVDRNLVRVVSLSLAVSGAACALAAGIGLLAGAWLAVVRFAGRRGVIVLLNTLLALPSVVVGLVVYLLLSRSGPLGELGILFTPSAMVVAQTILVLPVVTALTRQLIADAAHGNGEQLRSMGATPWVTALLLLAHERVSLVTVLLAAFGRAISEVGAVMIVGGNIDGVTRVMTTAIALETSKGDLPLALGLGIVLLGTVAVVNVAIALLQRLQGDRGEPMSALLELRGAGVRFGDVTALAAVDLSLRAGERIAVVGSNGSGKTTLLRLLHGQLPYSGERRVARDAAGREPSQAMVFQRPFLLRFSVWNNLLVALRLAGVARDERTRRASEALARVGLEDQRQRPARVLSGGQQHRLALARAWAVRPRLLFLDEPTASLDPHAKREVEALVGTFADEGMTMVMSTHNLGQAKRLASRVLYLEAGRVVVDRSTDAFFNERLPEAAAQFVKGELPWQ